ncbi:membrane-associated protein, putative [Bodo saltans]|uniref:Membrane-associated protein, putative n=1 Tax=Bodo saltans TaxID=75058 RepID=A0A0S4JF50_BODSA|nr:membrane-associated protein, putative [Bodo saltans]|eukprot:CUG90217.1 membrane-associated protein, putative [Bodo saltans]
MRSTSLGVAVLTLCTAVSMVLWLGANDSGSGRSSITTTSAAPVAEEQRFDADEVSRSDQHHWQWTGGGVRGLSEGDENIALDNVSATLRAAVIDLFNVPMFHFDLRHVSRTAPHIITRFRRLFMSFAVNSNDDCLIRMDPRIPVSTKTLRNFVTLLLLFFFRFSDWKRSSWSCRSSSVAQLSWPFSSAVTLQTSL